MTEISAKAILSSVGPTGPALHSLVLRYPRWIHAEGRTHRLLSISEEEVYEEFRTPSLMEDRNLSRNASSARAIPVKRLLDDILDNPAVPVFWGKNQKGMQAGEENTAELNHPVYGKISREDAWKLAMTEAITWASAFAEAGYHKQIGNRLVEAFSHINVVVTSSRWRNFFALRDHEGAEPHIRLLAQRIKEAIDGSIMRRLEPGEWHLPFVGEDQHRLSQIDAIKVSVARCARVSYLTHERSVPELADDLVLYDRLVGGVPLHASPAEHQATPDPSPDYRRVSHFVKENGLTLPDDYHGNLGPSWVQYRKLLLGEAWVG